MAATHPGKQVPFSLEQEQELPRSHLALRCQVSSASAQGSSLSPGWPEAIRQWVSGHWLTTGCSGVALPEQRCPHQGTAKSWKRLWVRGAHSQGLVPSRPWPSRVREPQELGQMSPCGAGDCWLCQGHCVPRAATSLQCRAGKKDYPFRRTSRVALT